MEVANIVYFLVLITFAPMGEHYQQETLVVKQILHDERECVQQMERRGKTRDPRTEKWGCIGVTHPMTDNEHERHRREGSGRQQGFGVGP